MKNRLQNIQILLSQDTVLADWFAPMNEALDKVRYHEKIFNTLSMPMFILAGCLRQLQSQKTLREQVQSLFHLDVTAEKPPLARSTWSDALASSKRRDITKAALSHLVAAARQQLPDRFDCMPGLGDRAVFAIDASYQTESSHYAPVYPNEKGLDGKKGTDNQKGHLSMLLYDLRKAVPVEVITETKSIGEMRLIKESAQEWTKVKEGIYVVDRAFLDARYWNERKDKYKVTTITRWKSPLAYDVIEERPIKALNCNENILADTTVILHASRKVPSKSPHWRRIEMHNEENELCIYLTNDFTLEPGEIAFLYHRRWDEEKYFDNFKNDQANSQGWGKSKMAIEQQSQIAAITYILTRLFIQSKTELSALSPLHGSQSGKHKAKREKYQKKGGIYLRAHWINLSKIPAQIWRFLKYCFSVKTSPQLYRVQLRRVLIGYL